jgi:dTDP-4-amino-4,6-dideoxygalactose transaminase
VSRLYLSPPDVGDEERALLLDAFDSNWIAPLGPHVDAFEQEFAARVAMPAAAALSSGLTLDLQRRKSLHHLIESRTPRLSHMRARY